MQQGYVNWILLLQNH